MKSQEDSYELNRKWRGKEAALNCRAAVERTHKTGKWIDRPVKEKWADRCFSWAETFWFVDWAVY